MKVKTIPSTWITAEGRRLDCGPFMSGALEARMMLAGLDAPTQRLDTLTRGHDGGIYNGPQFRRNYVDLPEYGVPFVTSGTVLRADLSTLPLLKRKDAESPMLSYLRLRKGMTLISCSGTIGRMAYAREEMDGMWSSQDVMKIVPDDDKVPSGYIYAFLASKYGVPMITARTYGAIIQHLEPHHIADLPVPRLGQAVEQRAHELVEEAAQLLSRYQTVISKATELFFSSVALQDIRAWQWHALGPDLDFDQKFPCQDSFRALNFNPRYKQLCRQIQSRQWLPLSQICLPNTLQRGGRYKRIDAAPEFSYQLIGQKQLFSLRPEGRFVAKSSMGDDVLVDPGTILIAAQGTLGESELYCRAEFIWGPGADYAYSEHLLRVISDGSIMPQGCLFAFLRSETAFRMLRSISSGSKLQDHHHIYRAQLPIPIPPSETQHAIHDIVIDAFAARHTAIALEDEARILVERTIEGAA